MTTISALKSVVDLNLDPIKAKLMNKSSGEGWDLAKANAVEIEYKRFLHLCKEFPDETMAPSKDVDTFWHHHILDTIKYAADCEAAFGYFLHHSPNAGPQAEHEADQVHTAARMRDLYEHAFNEPYGVVAHAICNPCFRLGGQVLPALRKPDPRAARAYT